MRKTHNHHLIILANQLLTPNLASGGDVLSFEILAKFKSIPLTVFAPKISESSIKSMVPDAKIKFSDKTNTIPSSDLIGGMVIVWLYFKRTLGTSYMLLVENNTKCLYLTGDFFCNSIPSVVYKIFHPKTKIYCNFYHLNPLPWKRENYLVFSTISWLLQRFSLLILKFSVEKFFVLTQEGKESLTSLGVVDNRILISGAGVSKDYYTTKSATGYSKCDILFVGRLNKSKGIYDAIQCLRIIVKNIPDVKMGVSGSCTDYEMKIIRKKIKKYHLRNNFNYFGFTSNIEKIKLMKSTRILLAPSHEEGFGIGILEGIASGMYVSAYDLPVYHLIFDKYKSMITYAPIGNIKLLSAPIINWLKKVKTPKIQVSVPTWGDIAKIQLTGMSGD